MAYKGYRANVLDSRIIFRVHLNFQIKILWRFLDSDYSDVMTALTEEVDNAKLKITQSISA